MQKIACGLKVALLFFATTLGLMGLLGSQAVYADAKSPDTQPVTITAVCQDENSAMASWRIGNPNPDPVAISWDSGAAAGTATAPYGFTDVTSSYDTSANSPEVSFSQNGQPTQTIAVSSDACANPDEDTVCVDGLVRANLTYTWSPTGTVTVSTVDDVALCDDVTVYLSSYTLPATYDGNNVFDDSSIPQQQFSSTSAVLQKGTAGDVTLQIAVPNGCTDYQLDLYYAPEITIVSYHGHGDQLIYGNIYTHTSSDCTPPAGGNGGGHVLGETTTTATLANTGSSTLVPTTSAIVLMLAAAFINFSIPARIKQTFTKLSK